MFGQAAASYVWADVDASQNVHEGLMLKNHQAYSYLGLGFYANSSGHITLIYIDIKYTAILHGFNAHQTLSINQSGTLWAPRRPGVVPEDRASKTWQMEKKQRKLPFL